MSLATRCIACGTVFRVVQDQLKVSEGWVRCGRCKEVFNALEGLFDLDVEAPPQWRPAEATNTDNDATVIDPQHRPPEPASAWAADSGGVDVDLSPEGLESQIGQQAALAAVKPQRFLPAGPAFRAPSISGATASGAVAAPEPAVPGLLRPADTGDSPSAAWQPAPVGTTSAPATIPPRRTASASTPPPPLPPDAPTFVRQSHAQTAPAAWARRHQSAIIVAALALLLLIQVAVAFRDSLAAAAPWTRPLIAVGCFAFGCSGEALHRIEDLVVESSALTRVSSPAQPDALKLAIALRNRGSLTLAMPMIDLSLTDNGGDLVLRRALSAADFKSSATRLAPGSETALQMVFVADGIRVSGYTVEVFYP